MSTFGAMSVVTETCTYVFKDLSDPRVYNWPLLSDPSEVVLILGVYIFGIYYFLPRFMAYRKPYSLKEIIAVYNVFQVIACTILIYGISTSGWTTTYTLGCQKVDYSKNKIALRMAKFMWWHMMLKMTELIETVFFVLRKKFNQVSLLHVYHHISTFIIAWICAKYFAGGMFTFTVLINSFIHILMYGYYLLSSLGVWQKGLQKFKPILTIAQMVQLCIIFVHSLQALLPSCDVSNTIALIYLTNIAINIYLFCRFFVRTYSV
ncbi:hypothetical protein ILUMI_27257 [Ignelater luminosus]|uniref:Elongation of very long chain fatty acids protein n=1 Tax=Ignelater luminosus TaxID=2038154 RepID=A0A8K0C578_IGNLU|nr:hypothetical protein ILUMI_27257 [Ignelater luminosus]